MNQTIKIHIRSIVLDGIELTPQQQAEFKVRLKRDLTQQLATKTNNHWEKPWSAQALQADPIDIGSRVNPAHMSQQLAQQIVSSLAP